MSGSTTCHVVTIKTDKGGYCGCRAKNALAHIHMYSFLCPQAAYYSFLFAHVEIKHLSYLLWMGLDSLSYECKGHRTFFDLLSQYLCDISYGTDKGMFHCCRIYGFIDIEVLSIDIASY